MAVTRSREPRHHNARMFRMPASAKPNSPGDQTVRALLVRPFKRNPASRHVPSGAAGHDPGPHDDVEPTDDLLRRLREAGL